MPWYRLLRLVKLGRISIFLDPERKKLLVGDGRGRIRRLFGRRRNGCGTADSESREPVLQRHH